MTVTAASVIVFDPHGVVDSSDDFVEYGPLTLNAEGQNEGEGRAPFAVVTTMLNVETDKHWYVVAYYVRRADAEADLLHEQEEVRDAQSSDIDDYLDMHLSVSLMEL